LACKIPGYNDPKLAALDADPAELRLLPANADANKWQKNAEYWRFLATEWRSRYNIVNVLALKTPDCKATNVSPPQNVSLHAQTGLSNDYCVEPKPTIVTAGDKDSGKTAASLGLPAVEDYVKKGPVARKSAKALGKSVIETSGSPVALKSAFVKPGCLAAVSEPVRLPQLQFRFAPHVPDGTCVAAGIPRPGYEDSESVAVMYPISASMGADDTETFSATSICSASGTLVEVLAPLRSITASQPAVHQKPMVTRFSTSAPPKFAAPLARTKPTAAMENDSFLPFYRSLPSSIPLLGY
jgi:hypothetical protein